METEPEHPGNAPDGALLSEYLACSNPPPEELNDVRFIPY
jgi:hypothetical protein